MTDQLEKTMSGARRQSGASWRLVPLAAAASLAAVAWRWPSLLEGRIGSLIAMTVIVLVLAAATIAVLRTRMLPLAVRLIAAALAVYAITAVVQGALVGATFGEMMSGAGLWQAVPRWFRGAFIGGCVILPLAAVVQAVKAGLRGWRSSSSTTWRELNEGLVYALCAATALSTWTPSRDTSQPSSVATTLAIPAALPASFAVLPTPDAVPATDVDPIAFVKNTDSLVQRTPRLDWDVDARADALDSGVEPAFAYVRDAIRYEAYPGVLRGASGTYTARAGNAADRAVLLAHFLERKKIRTRFAMGTLDPASRERLWQQIFDTSIPGTPRPGGSPTSSGASAAFRQRVNARATRDYAVVKAALGARLPPVTKPSREDVLTEMNPHVWVQAEVDGGWVDLDPSFPGGKPGTANTAVERTVTELPADLYQTVAIRLKVEQLSHGEFSETTVLDRSANAVNLIDRQVFVTHVAGKPMAMANIGASLGAYNTWTPALWIAGDFTYGTTFTIDESGSSAPTADQGRPPGPGEGGMAGVLDALSARPAGSPTTVTTSTGPIFVAEWLEFELRAPGGQREVTRRVLVDRASAAWRTAKPLSASGLTRLERADLGPTSMRALHNVWFSAGPHNLADYAEAIQDLAYKHLDAAFPEDTTAEGAPPSDVGGKDDHDFGESVWSFALQNFAWMIWADHGVIPRLNDTAGLRLYTDRPRIAIFTMASDRTGRMELETDLRRDDLREVAMNTIPPTLRAEKKLWFGILQGAFEHEMLADTIAAGGGDRATVETTSGRLSPEGVAVIAPGDPLPSGARAPHPDSAVRLSAALSAGMVIVAPVAGLGASGVWWEIAPGTGATTSVGALELHAGRGYNPNYDLPKNGKPVQQNPFGGQKPNYTPEAAKEARDAQRAANNAKKSADYAKNYQRQQNELARQQQRKGGGDEYSTLVTVMMVVGAVAYTLIGLGVLLVTMMATEAAISSLTE
jgi:hypothetical protein